MFHPFAGIYETIMIPNAMEDETERLTQLSDAIKIVYASTFFQEARDYIRATGL